MEVTQKKELEWKLSFFITGSTGMVGKRFYEMIGEKTFVAGPTHAQFDLLMDENELAQQFKMQNINPVVNFAAITYVDGCEEEKGNKDGDVWQTNVEGAKKLARACKNLDIALIHISTDYVLSGKTYPHREVEKPDPVDSWYAQSKAAAEEELGKIGGKVHIVRIQLPFTDDLRFKKHLPWFVVDRLSKGQQFMGVSDQYVTPVYVDDCTEAIFQIARSKDYGVWHVATPTIVTPYEFSHMVVKSVGKYGLELDESLIKETTFEEFNKTRLAPRPKDNAFDIPDGRFVEHFGGKILRPLDQMLDDWARHYVKNLRSSGIYGTV